MIIEDNQSNLNNLSFEILLSEEDIEEEDVRCLPRHTSDKLSPGLS